ncbi:MAG: hypothetical protein HUJ25_05715 [Crocinitomicaceae bacterium]|nr:hypothetical protein [Crocinitomicaceae bacterium]
MKKILALIVAVLLISTWSLGQENNKKIGHKEYSIVGYDLFNNMVNEYLPFDVQFILAGQVPKEVQEIEFFYISEGDLRESRHDTKADIRAKLELLIDYLERSKPNSVVQQTAESVNRPDQRSQLENISFYLENKQLTKADSILQAAKKNNEFNRNLIKGYENQIKSLQEDIKKIKSSSWQRGNELLRINSDTNVDSFYVYIEPLKSNTEYYFFIRKTYQIQDNALDASFLRIIKNHIANNTILEKPDTSDSSELDLDYFLKFNELTLTEGDKQLTEFFSEKIYDDLADHAILFFKKKYQFTKITQEEVKESLKVNININSFSEYSKKYEDQKLKMIKIKKYAETLYLKQSSDVLDALYKLEQTELINDVTNLEVLTAYNPGHDLYNIGREGFKEFRSFPDLEYISNPKSLDTLQANLSYTCQLVSSTKDKIKLAFKTEKIMRGFHPEEYEDFQKKKDELKDKPEALAKLKQEFKKTWQKEQQNLDKLLKGYDHYIEGLKNIKSELQNLQYLVIASQESWNVIATQIYTSIDHISNIQDAFNRNTTNDFMTRAEYYISADLGIAAMTFKDMNAQNFGVKTIQPYLGVNFNLFPINRQAHYSMLSKPIHGRTWCQNVFRGSSIVIGITQRDVGVDIFDSTSTHIKGLWNAPKIMLLTGYGLRLSDYIRLTVGTSWFRYRASYNPVSNEQWKLGTSFYFSLSLDWDVRSFVSNITGQLFKGVNGIGG